MHLFNTRCSFRMGYNNTNGVCVSCFVFSIDKEYCESRYILKRYLTSDLQCVFVYEGYLELQMQSIDELFSVLSIIYKIRIVSMSADVLKRKKLDFP